MGKHLEELDWQALQGLSFQLVGLYDYKQTLLSYLESVLKRYNPNVHALLGTTIAARVIAGAGSRRRLAVLPASTIQLLGAEKALFRHLKSGARSPKHGYVVNHQLLQQARRENRGKVARALADKAAICAKLDYFEGDFLGEQYLKDLQKRFS
jgi:nucleolar protein 56